MLPGPIELGSRYVLSTTQQSTVYTQARRMYTIIASKGFIEAQCVLTLPSVQHWRRESGMQVRVKHEERGRMT